MASSSNINGNIHGTTAPNNNDYIQDSDNLYEENIENIPAEPITELEIGLHDTHLMSTDRLSRKLDRALKGEGITLTDAEMAELIYRIQYAIEHNGSKLQRKEGNIAKQTIKLHVKEVVGSYRGHMVTAFQLGDAGVSLFSGGLGLFPKGSLSLLHRMQLFKGIHDISKVMSTIEVGSKVLGTGANITQRSLDNVRTEADSSRNVTQSEKQRNDEQSRETSDRKSAKERQLLDAERAKHELWISAARA